MTALFLERNAVRILFILYFCGERQLQLPLEEDLCYLCRLDSESKLQKIDFWLRYPDHLAAALLHECQPEGTLAHRKEEVKGNVRQIFREREPVLRWVPMRKYLR